MATVVGDLATVVGDLAPEIRDETGVLIGVLHEKVDPWRRGSYFDVGVPSILNIN